MPEQLDGTKSRSNIVQECLYGQSQTTIYYIESVGSGFSCYVIKTEFAVLGTAQVSRGPRPQRVIRRMNVGDMSVNLEFWWYRVAESEFDVLLRNGINDLSAEELKQLHTDGTDTTELNNTNEKWCRYSSNKENKIKHDHDGSSTYIVCVNIIMTQTKWLTVHNLE